MKKVTSVKKKILNFLDRIKEIPDIIFFIFFILIFSVQFFNIGYIWIITTFLSIIISYVYFIGVLYSINKKSSIRFFEFPNVLRYYYKTDNRYLKRQIKHVFTEEFIIRYLPVLITRIFSDNIYILLAVALISTVFFMYLHRFNNIVELLEFLFFFGTVYFFFVKFFDFGVLFFPHLIRNLIIEYQVKTKILIKHDK